MYSLCLQKNFRATISLSRFKSPRRNSDEYYRQLTIQRKRGIIGEVNVLSAMSSSAIEKHATTKDLLKSAILKNKFLGDLDEIRLDELTEQMYPKSVKANTRLIHEGETGSHLYVSEEGTFDIYIGNTYYGNFGPGVAFGELALLYNTKRFCSIDARTNGKVWMLDRKVFQSVMFKKDEEAVQHNLRVLRRVSLLRSFPEEVLLKISDLIVVEFYTANSYIVREGDTGDKFFIVNGGNVKITKSKVSGFEEELMILDKGDYFGEKALYEEGERRQANAIAMPPGAECYTIDRKAFLDYLGGLETIRKKDWQTYQKTLIADDWDQEYCKLSLADLDPEGTIGTGGYGRVELVTTELMPNMSFARKKVKKHMITIHGYQKLIYNEKDNLRMCNSPFVCKLYRTFKDDRYLYFLMEVCLGGDLRTALHKVTRYDNSSAKFISACVVEGLNHLHTLGIIYRDLKPENIVISRNGYVKLADLGSSKKIGPYKTKTFIGTPEYLAPEIIQSKPYNKSADYWALGIFIYELLVGRTPFQDMNEVEVYNKILEGFNEAATPPIVKSAAKNLIRGLLQEDPIKRLGHMKNGIADIRNHRWFHTLNWRDLQREKLISPIVPTVKDHLDLRNFERYPPDRDAAPCDFSDWDINF